MGVPLEKVILYLPELTLIFYVIGGSGLIVWLIVE
jgi:hypothetical protein